MLFRRQGVSAFVTADMALWRKSFKGEDLTVEFAPWIVAGLAVLVAAYGLWRGSQRPDADPMARADLDAARSAAATAQAERAAMAARREGAEKRQAELLAERDAAQAAMRAETDKRVGAERAAALAVQARQEIEGRLADFEKAKAELILAARAASLDASTELAKQLVAQHKQETEAAKKASEEEVRKTTEQLTASVQRVGEFAASLRDRVTESHAVIEKVNRALSNPGGAGQMGEMILENTLKSFGLERERDFAIQYDTGGETRLRPDAVVFLPGDAILVIDSKASKFLVEIAGAADAAAEQSARAALATTMHGHLRALTGKDYAKAVREEYRRTGREGEVRHVINAMFVPTDGALEHLRAADAGFFNAAADARIIPVGPSGLNSLLTIARLQIEAGRRAENHEKIVEATDKLVDSVVVALGHMGRIGGGIKAAADAFEKLASSVDSRLIPRLRAVARLGIAPGTTPRAMPHFKVVALDDQPLIEGEAAGDEPPALPPN